MREVLQRAPLGHRAGPGHAMLTPLGRRFLLASIVAALLSIGIYAQTTRGLPVPASGRSAPGMAFGVLGTLAMMGAGAYSWRRRFIARASRSIAVSTAARKDLLAREKRALEQLQALSRKLMRSPGENAQGIAREARKILKDNDVTRTIRARVTGGRGRAVRLQLERREWGGRLQTWYYWHLSLGSLAILLILLHGGFRFGNLIATLAFVFLVGVVATGALGVLIYWLVPPALTRIEERAECTPEELREELVEVRQELEGLAVDKSETFRRVYAQELAIPGVSMTPSLRWLTGQSEIERDTARPDRLRLIVMEIKPSEQEDFRKLVRLLFRKEKIEVSLYPQLRYDYLMKVWLSAHIPLSVGLAAFAVIHIASIFYY